jgi:hypothetical protein
MVFVLHKFRHYLLGNKFVCYVDHMALVLFGQQTTCFKDNSSMVVCVPKI